MKRIGLGTLAILAVVGVFFGSVIVKGRVLLPGDLLVGAYYPWLTEKWGYPAGVPIKNPMMSDVISQDFIWKSLVAEAFRGGGLPLWNLYSYSGYPLLANFQSGALYPFNFLMVWWGDIAGWNWLLIGGVVGGALGMYLFLVNKRLSVTAAVAGALTYALNAYAMTWMEFVSAAQVMLWFPWLLLAVELNFRDRKLGWGLLPAAVFMCLTAGQFQVATFVLVAVSGYILYMGLGRKKWRMILLNIFLIVVGLGLSMPQILPTVELAARSVRGEENYIAAQRWGLIPVGQVITGIAPDFFGNPATGNHWGWWQYHETVFYAGIVAVIALVSGLLEWKHLGKFKFFWLLAIVGLVLGLDTPVGEIIYKLKVPIISTSSAGRVFVWYEMGAAVIVAWYVDRIKEISRGKVFRGWLYPAVIMALFFTVAAGIRWGLKSDWPPIPETRARLLVSLRNSAVPITILLLVGAVLIFRKKKYFGILFCLVIVGDLCRMGWKYLPMVEKKLIYPADEVTEFLTTENKKDIFRIDRENGEVMPPNTWAAYRLMSPSGYDPLAVEDYVAVYSRDLNNSDPILSRYSELDRYDADALGKYNVKYFLAIKRDKEGRIPGEILSYKINEKDWIRVKETKNIVILENKKYQLRVRLMGGGTVLIKEYTAGNIIVDYSGAMIGTRITVADAYYPGWQVCEEGKCEPVGEDGVFMTTNTKEKSGEIRFIYKPESFKIGVEIMGLSVLVWIGGLIFLSKKSQEERKF